MEIEEDEEGGILDYHKLEMFFWYSSSVKNNLDIS